MAISEAEISTLVDRFYARVRDDAEIGPVFEAAVQHWAAHLAMLKDFWSSVLLGTGRYKGNPLLAHFNLPIEERHFQRWLALFGETAQQVLSPDHAAIVLERAESIAVNMRRVLLQRGPKATFVQP